jgi:hypothetical protein
MQWPQPAMKRFQIVVVCYDNKARVAFLWLMDDINWEPYLFKLS